LARARGWLNAVPPPRFKSDEGRERSFGGGFGIPDRVEVRPRACFVDFPSVPRARERASTRGDGGEAAPTPNESQLNAFVAAAVAKGTPRGWRLDSSEREALIDPVVALEALKRPRARPAIGLLVVRAQRTMRIRTIRPKSTSGNSIGSPSFEFRLQDLLALEAHR
jgi:hypothetical protein